MRAVRIIALSLVFGGCAAPHGHEHGHDHDATPPAVVAAKPLPGTALEGTITYRPRVALSPEAIVKVWLQDVSRPGLPVPEILDEQEIRGPGQVPVAFSLRYDPAAIDPTHTYTLLVRIYEGDRTQFTNARPYPVLTHGACANRCEVVVDLMQ